MIALLLAVMTILTFVQCILRYIFNTGFPWALEATGYMFGWLIFLGISYGVKKGSHIGVDVLVKKLPVGAQRAVGWALPLEAHQHVVPLSDDRGAIDRRSGVDRRDAPRSSRSRASWPRRSPPS